LITGEDALSSQRARLVAVVSLVIASLALITAGLA
jgi:hypothetical protein